MILLINWYFCLEVRLHVIIFKHEKFRDQSVQVHSLPKVLINQQPNKEKRVIKATDVLHHTHYCVNLPLIYVKVTVYFKYLLEIHASSNTFIRIWQKICVLSSLIEVIDLFIVEESENVIIKFNLGLLKESLIVNRLLGLKTDKKIIKILKNRVLIIWMIEKWAHNNLLNCNFFHPVLKLFLIWTLWTF